MIRLYIIFTNRRRNTTNIMYYIQILYEIHNKQLSKNRCKRSINRSRSWSVFSKTHWLHGHVSSNKDITLSPIKINTLISMPLTTVNLPKCKIKLEILSGLRSRRLGGKTSVIGTRLVASSYTVLLYVITVMPLEWQFVSTSQTLEVGHSSGWGESKTGLSGALYYRQQ